MGSQSRSCYIFKLLTSKDPMDGIGGTVPENESIVEPEDISMARKIDQTLKIHKPERKCSQNGDTYTNFFKIADDEDPFYVKGYWGKSEIICNYVETSESDDECAKC